MKLIKYIINLIILTVSLVFLKRLSDLNVVDGENIMIKIPFLNRFLLRLYGNFELNNSKLESIMNVKLKTTNQSLPRIYL